MQKWSQWRCPPQGSQRLRYPLFDCPGGVSWRAWPLSDRLNLGGAPGAHRCPLLGSRVPVSVGRVRRDASLWPDPDDASRLRWLRPVLRLVCGFWVFGSASLALHSLALCCVCANAPSFVSGWWAFSSVSLCKCRYTGTRTGKPNQIGRSQQSQGKKQKNVNSTVVRQILMNQEQKAVTLTDLLSRLSGFEATAQLQQRQDEEEVATALQAKAAAKQKAHDKCSVLLPSPYESSERIGCQMRAMLAEAGRTPEAVLTVCGS
jgi:hypothetical protein